MTKLGKKRPLWITSFALWLGLAAAQTPQSSQVPLDKLIEALTPMNLQGVLIMGNADEMQGLARQLVALTKAHPTAKLVFDKCPGQGIPAIKIGGRFSTIAVIAWSGQATYLASGKAPTLQVISFPGSYGSSLIHQLGLDPILANKGESCP